MTLYTTNIITVEAMYDKPTYKLSVLAAILQWKSNDYYVL